MLCSVSLHGGLAFYDWGLNPGETQFANAPVAVSLLPARDFTTPVLTSTPLAVSPPVPQRQKVSKVKEKKSSAPAKVTATVSQKMSPQKPSGQLSETKRMDKVQVKPNVEASTNEVVCMLPQKLVANKSMALPEDDQSAVDAVATDKLTEKTTDGLKLLSAKEIEEGLLTDTVTSSQELSKATPNYRSNPLPEYPYQARLKHWEGVVWLLVDVSADGSVDDLRVEKSCGHRVLDQTASRTVRRWQFTPAKRAGLPVLSQVRIPVRFHLEDD